MLHVGTHLRQAQDMGWQGTCHNRHTSQTAMRYMLATTIATHGLATNEHPPSSSWPVRTSFQELLDLHVQGHRGKHLHGELG